MPHLDLITPVTPPPEITTFARSTNTGASTQKPLDTPPTMSLKRKATSQLPRPAGPPQPQPSQAHSTLLQQLPLPPRPQVPITDAAMSAQQESLKNHLAGFPPSVPSHGVPRDPMGAFRALGLIPDVAAAGRALANPVFAAWNVQAQQGQMSATQNSASSAATNNESAPSSSTTGNIHTNDTSTSPTLEASPLPQTNPPTDPTTSLPHPMTAPMPLPTSPFLMALQEQGDQAKLQMYASRIAAYYQQRCQAIATFQHQKCQAWAALQRQKCQETMQAAMLVVAWYVRDRLQRKKRKEKKRFARGIRKLNKKARVTRRLTVKERVDTWTKMVSSEDKLLDVDNVVDMKERKLDQEEESFTLDIEPPLDRDGKLMKAADSLIRSQYRKVEVPLFGLLNFDEEAEESEESDEEVDDEDEDEEEEEGEEEEEEFELEEDDIADIEDIDMPFMETDRPQFSCPGYQIPGARPRV